MPLEMKPLSEMSEEEMMVWIEELRAKREALRAEGIAKKAAGEKVDRAPRAPRQPKPVDNTLKDIVNEDLWK